MAHDPVRVQLVMYGGLAADGRRGDTWERWGGTWQRTDPVGQDPPGRGAAVGAWDATGERLLVFGGGRQAPDGSWDGTVRNDTWVWDGRGWTMRAVDAPARQHAPILVGTGDGLVLFGGSDAEESHGDLWRWDGARWDRIGEKRDGT